MTTSFHVAVSVDIDRFSNRELERVWCSVMRNTATGKKTTPFELRDFCALARASGLSVFPHPDCDHRNADGSCAGHAETGADT